MLHDPNTLEALSPEVEASLEAQMPSDEARYMARKYFKDWGKQSPHLDGVAIVTWAALMIHARGEEQSTVKTARLEDMQSKTERRKARASREQFGTEWLAWQAQCSQRNAWIEGLSAEWRNRVAQRKVNMAQWDAYVDEARIAFQNAKATPAPPQPVKVAQ